MHWDFLYTPVMAESLRGELPRLSESAGTAAASLDHVGIRMKFSFWGTTRLVSRAFGRSSFYSDASDEEFRDRLDLISNRRAFEYLISIRPALLPYRVGIEISFEPYFPHYGARQLGLDQTTPPSPPALVTVSADPYGVSKAWAALFRRGTGSDFIFPSRSRAYRADVLFMRWHTSELSSFLLRPAQVLASATCRVPLKKPNADIERAHSQARVLSQGSASQGVYDYHGQDSGLPPPSFPPSMVPAGIFFLTTSFYLFRYLLMVVSLVIIFAFSNFR